ncbi:hypothetical protein LCGC14_2955480 [marine sediment metagenome]|uniref:Uncharacterized protein n=1 Tax=marine sediment metagenome TaxID=412755 RepID=A0A0F8XDK1_9ZZZZ
MPENYPNEYDNLINAAEAGGEAGITHRRTMLAEFRRLEDENARLWAIVNMVPEATALAKEPRNVD